MPSSTDRIERQILLAAPLSRVWRAISTAEEFGNWFGVKFAGQSFVAGERTLGQITYPGYEHLSMDILIERVIPERFLSFRWHPYAIDPAVDYSSEPTTLVEFKLAEIEGKTQVTIVESGFDAIPAGRRDEAFRMNSGGWDAQIINIAKHVETA